MLMNNHDYWILFCEKHREVLAKTGLPDKLVNSKNRFYDLLSDGKASVSGVAATMEGMTPNQWKALEEFYEILCDNDIDEGSYMFEAYSRELSRRAKQRT